jgi:hypothetical protein
VTAGSFFIVKDAEESTTRRKPTRHIQTSSEMSLKLIALMGKAAAGILSAESARGILYHKLTTALANLPTPITSSDDNTKMSTPAIFVGGRR